MTAPVMTTERLTLRPYRLEDFPAVAAFFADAEASHWYGGPLDQDGAWLHFATWFGEWAIYGYGRWAVTERETGRYLGGVGFSNAPGWPCAEVTWFMLPEARGQGYASEAARAAVRYGYDTLGWDEVHTFYRDGNTGSERLVAGLGGTKVRRALCPDGHSRDVFILPRDQAERGTAA